MRLNKSCLLFADEGGPRKIPGWWQSTPLEHLWLHLPINPYSESCRKTLGIEERNFWMTPTWKSKRVTLTLSCLQWNIRRILIVIQLKSVRKSKCGVRLSEKVSESRRGIVLKPHCGTFQVTKLMLFCEQITHNMLPRLTKHYFSFFCEALWVNLCMNSVL